MFYLIRPSALRFDTESIKLRQAKDTRDASRCQDRVKPELTVKRPCLAEPKDTQQQIKRAEPISTGKPGCFVLTRLRTSQVL